MRATRILMGMPITVEVVDAADGAIVDAVFAYFDAVDRRFSTYRADSEIAAINRGGLRDADYSAEMREVLALAEQTKRETDGYFDIRKPDGSLDPSGIVKGWAIRNAAAMIAALRRPRLLHRCRRRHPVVGQERVGRRLERRHPQPVQPGGNHQGRLPARPRRRHLRHLCPRTAHLQSRTRPAARSSTSSA